MISTLSTDLGAVHARSEQRLDFAVPLRAVERTWTGEDGELFASKLVRQDDPYLEGHYPGAPIFPGVFTLEAAIQAVTRHLTALDPTRRIRLHRIASVRFRAPFFPGDELTARIRVSYESDSARAMCKVFGDEGTTRASMTLEFALGPGGAS